ncbi:DMT family transporter [Candidatus Pacearchaeota archaeon]|nr:DMT family transporter [Candidatus Pacearchaeota archaeon]
MIQIPIIGAFLEAAGMILEKKVLRNKRINYKNYTVYEFLAIVLVMIPILFFTWKIGSGAFSTKNILIFSFVILVSVIANLLIFFSLKRENVTEFESVWVAQPLFTIILAFILFQSERKISLAIFAFVASIALLISHIEKHHLKFDKYIIAAILGSFLFSVELIASNLILKYYNPFTFYFIRSFFIFLITFAMFRPSGNELKNKSLLTTILIIGLIWALYRAIIYYGYQTLGVIFTTTIFILSPVLIFLFAIIFLKEKPTKKQVLSTLIITLCVIASLIFGK